MTTVLSGSQLTIDQVVRIARKGEKVALAPEALDRIRACRAMLEKKIAAHEIMYGVNTGIGEFSEVVLTDEQVSQFQRYLIYNHAAGIGDPLSIEEVRAARPLVRGEGVDQVAACGSSLQFLPCGFFGHHDLLAPELDRELEPVDRFSASRRPLESQPAFRGKSDLLHSNIEQWRRGSESNRRIKVLQTFALPLGYRARSEALVAK